MTGTLVIQLWGAITSAEIFFFFDFAAVTSVGNPTTLTVHQGGPGCVVGCYYVNCVKVCCICYVAFV